MSTMLETIPIAPSYAGSASVANCSAESYVHLQVPGEHLKRTLEVTQLEHRLLQLASQHHASEYNRLKFGPKGSPMTYVPLSIMMPDHHRQLQEHQARCAGQQAWWPSEKRATRQDSLYDDYDERPRSRNPSLSHASSSTDLRQELSAAISSQLILPLNPPVYPTTAQAHIKTSESHPINVSAIIPVELIRIISAHIVESEQPSAVMFEVPPVYYLNCAVLRPASSSPYPQQRPAPPSAPLGGMRSVTAPPCSTTYSLVRPTKLAHLFWSNPAVRRAFHSALGTGMNSPHSMRFRTKSMTTSETVFNDPFTFSPPSTSSRDCSTDRSNIYSYEKQGPHGDPRLQSTPPDGAVDIKASPRAHPVMISDPVSTAPHAPAESIDSLSRPSTPTVIPPQPVVCYPTILGNLYLSSCPGKKVRLDGPIKGRTGVCRDLCKDLMRMKELGVACIICCLDDGELEFLGVSWPEYVSIADKLGIDMLRLPTPEGLAPTDPAVLDEHLTHLIKTFTLRGAPILIHCRGGVGRAGLLACCWILKLGLCGWIDTEPPLELEGAPEDAYQPLSTDADSDLGKTEPVRRDTMQLVERLITVVRRRRSPKAIETYEQVKFLVDYVEFLRTGSSIIPDWSTQVD